MNLKTELQQMSLLDLKDVCRELGVSCPTTKRDIIKKLLDPLKNTYKYNMNSNNKRKIKEIDLLHSKIQNAIKHIQKIGNQYRKNPKILLRCNIIDRTLKELDNVLIFKNNFGISGDYKRQIKEKIRVLNEYLQNAIDNENQNTKICSDLCSMSYKNFWKRYNSQVKMTISNKYLEEIKVILRQIEVILSSNYRSLNDLIQSLEHIIQELKEIVINIKHEKDSILSFLNNDINNKLIKYRLTVRESPDRKNLDEDINFDILNQ